MQPKTKCLIKSTFFFLFSCFMSFITYGQSNEKAIKKIYLQAATGFSNHNGVSGEIGIQTVFKKNWTTTLSYQGIDMEPKNLPNDYDPGSIIIIIPIEGETPSVDVQLISFTMGKYFKSGRNTWFTTEAGLSYVQGKKFEFSKNVEGSPTWVFPLIGEIPPNYIAREEKATTVGAMLKADFNWAFASFAGLGAGVFANLNSIQSPVGFQIKLLVGKMNREKKNRSHK